MVVSFLNQILKVSYRLKRKDGTEFDLIACGPVIDEDDFVIVVMDRRDGKVTIGRNSIVQTETRTEEDLTK